MKKKKLFLSFPASCDIRFLKESGRTAAIVFLVTASHLLPAQNLVPNPSFETMSASCSAGNGQINLAPPWGRPPGSITTPDLYNSCVTGGCSFDVPDNWVGVANAFSGIGYSGIAVGNYGACPNCREYIRVQLTSPLAASTQYCVSFRVLRASYTWTASNNLGIYISNGPVSQPGNQPINTVTPQINSTSIIQDSANWTLVSGVYTAAGGENYITIGNFYDDVNTLFFNYTPFSAACTNAFITEKAAYYYIDSVFVGLCLAQPPVANFTANSANICVGDCINFTDLTASNPTSWNWIFPGGTPASSTQQNPAGICYNAPGTYTVTLTASNVNGSDTATLVITVNAPPAATITGNTTICSGNTTTLTANPNGYTYLWNPDTSGQTTQSITITPTANTTYTVIVSSGNCTDTATVLVTVNSPPVASANNATICSGEAATLAAAGGGNYAWSNGETISSITTFSAGTYSVIVSIGNCSDTAFAIVTVNPNPTAGAASNVTITQGNSATLSASGGGNYSWSNGATDSVITVSPFVTTLYCVTVTDANNCTDTDCVTVMVIAEPLDCSGAGELYLPNAFSPNDDGENDKLQIYYGNLKCIKTFNLVIYNRWGEKVFETANSLAEWDGSFRGKIENTAVFVYYMEVTLQNGKEIVRKGNISLIK